jgi:chemotaxis protein MotB
VAYADFVTAMMAFFLVMWLLAISSEQGREALADYFSELTMSDAVFNGGLPSAFTEGGAKRPGILEGGCFKPKSEGDVTVDTEANNEAVEAQMMALLETSQKLLQNLESLPEGVDGGEGSGDAGRSDAAPGDPGAGGGGGPLTAAQENFKNQLLTQVEGSLGDAAAGQLLVERIKGGLRIQVMDRDGRPLFQSGGARLTGQGRALFQAVAERLKDQPNKISIEGHTDGLRMAGQQVTNWELSTARASAARIALNQAGLSSDRLTAVTGYADTKPLFGTDPNDPQNRRVSIMIWDADPAPGLAPAPPPQAVTPQAVTPQAVPPQAVPPQTPIAPNLGAEAIPEITEPPANAASSGGLRRPNPTTTTPPPLPRLPAARPAQPQAPPGRTREQLESEIIEDSMQRAATDRSTAGPPLPPDDDR